MIKLELDDLEMWLVPEDIKEQTVITFVDAGKRGEIPKEGGEENVPTFEIKVKLPNNEIRLWTMNKTSQRAVAKAYTKKTDLWIGKQATLFTTTQNVRGTMKQVIYAKTPDKVPA
jgi:hypothetical protein